MTSYDTYCDVSPLQYDVCILRYFLGNSVKKYGASLVKCKAVYFIRVSQGFKISPEWTDKGMSFINLYTLTSNHPGCNFQTIHSPGLGIEPSTTLMRF